MQVVREACLQYMPGLEPGRTAAAAAALLVCVLQQLVQGRFDVCHWLASRPAGAAKHR
jgi:hypothetical protein